MPICRVCGKDSFWTVDVASKICKDCKKKEKLANKEKKDEEKKQQFAEQLLIEKEELKKEKQTPSQKYKNEKQTLSQKYSVLEHYKGLAYLMMFLSTGFTIYSFIQISKASNEMKKHGVGGSMDNAMLTLVITYVITMFSLFCLTKLIDFLFDLDLNKSNK